MSGGSLLIALVTSFAWEVPSAVNHHVAMLARGLLQHGHRPVVLTSSDQVSELRRMRSLVGRDGESASSLLREWDGRRPPDDLLLPHPGLGPLAAQDGVAVVPLGRSFPVRLNGAVANLGLPVDLLSRLEALLAHGGFDVVHVHEPIAPSLSFTAIREARSPVVSTFHMSPVALPAYEWEHGLLERFYELLDRRIVTIPEAARVLEDRLGGSYEAIPPGHVGGAGEAAPSPSEVVYVYRGDDRQGMRYFLKSLAASPPSEVGEVVLAVDRASAQKWPLRRLPRAVRPFVRREDFSGDAEQASLLQGAQVAVLPFLGGEWLHTIALEARAAGCALLAPDLPSTKLVLDSVGGGGDGVVFSPAPGEGSIGDLLDQMTRSRRGSVPVRTSPPLSTWEEVAGRAAAVYEDVLADRGAGVQGGVRATRLPGPRRAKLGAKSAGGADGWIYADLHVHSEYSGDCRSRIPDILDTALQVGLGVIAVADHNTVKGGLEARGLAGGEPMVIVGEEVKTSQGEVMGLFLEEDIPGGLSFQETLARIKEQGGLAYVPHPFDRLRTTPSYRLLAGNVQSLDIIETYNARMALSSFNLRAERFAEKYGLVAGAGSDAHVLPGLGTAMLHMPRFEGRDNFIASLRVADILTRRKSLVYLQSLKLLQQTLERVSAG